MTLSVAMQPPTEPPCECYPITPRPYGHKKVNDIERTYHATEIVLPTPWAVTERGDPGSARCMSCRPELAESMQLANPSENCTLHAIAPPGSARVIVRPAKIAPNDLLYTHDAATLFATTHTRLETRGTSKIAMCTAEPSATSEPGP